MRTFEEEYVIKAKPKRIQDINQEAEELLRLLSPRAIVKPTPLLGEQLLKFVEFRDRISVIPTDGVDLGDNEAVTVLEEPVQIWLREDQYDYLFSDGPYSRRPKVTLLHERYHAKVHAPFVQARRQSSLRLARSRRRDIPAYMDPEWQAFAFAGCVLMPLRALHKVRPLNAENVSKTFNVSQAFAERHLGILSRNGLLPL